MSKDGNYISSYLIKIPAEIAKYDHFDSNDFNFFYFFIFFLIAKK